MWPARTHRTAKLAGTSAEAERRFQPALVFSVSRCGALRSGALLGARGRHACRRIEHGDALADSRRRFSVRYGGQSHVRDVLVHGTRRRSRAGTSTWPTNASIRLDDERSGYDIVKGFAGWAVELYNRANPPVLSVGESLDGDAQRVVNWIDSSHP